MASKTIKISPIPENCTEQDIKSALNDSTITRILIKKSEAYVQFDSEDTVDVLEFACPDNRLYQLGDTTFEKVQSDFNWDSLSSDSSSAQELKEDREHFQKMEEHIVDLTEPPQSNLVTISNCDVTMLSNLSEKDLKSTVFSQFSSIHRILKRGNKVIVQFGDLAETQKLDIYFPGLKIIGLGAEAYVDLEAEDVTAFSSEWIKQHNEQTQQGSAKEQKHVLHEEIIPKFEKMTSMESNFIKSQQSSGAKVQNKIQEIIEHQLENIHTKNQLPSENQGFILDQQQERQEIFIGITNEQEEAQKKRVEQEQLKRKQQEERKMHEKQQREIEEKERREKQQRQKERAQRERQQKERIQREKQQKERIQRERQQKERQERQRQQKERIQREKQQKERQERQRQERQKQERQKAEKERLERERLEKQKAQKEKIEKERLDRERALENQRIQSQKREKQRLQKQQQQRIRLAEEDRKRKAQEQKKKVQEFERKRAEDLRRARLEEQKRLQQEQARKQAQQFVLTQEQPKPSQNIDVQPKKQPQQVSLTENQPKPRQNEEKPPKRQESNQFVIKQEPKPQPNPRQIEEKLINTGSETLNNLIGSQPRTPIVFWTVALIVLFALLLI